MEGLTSTFTGLLAEAGTDFQGELVDKFYPPLGQCLEDSTSYLSLGRKGLSPEDRQGLPSQADHQIFAVPPGSE
jgi:hypothetical protein